jgi:hypothetical protein
MTRVRMLGLAVVASVVLAVGLGAGLAQDKQAGKARRVAPAGKHDSHAKEFEKCAKACSDCQRICDACATHCAHMVANGQTEHMHTLQTCRDCASFCAAAAQIVARHGPFSDLICTSCAEACARCGAACEKHPNDEHMKRCAEECRRCEKACREMLKHVGHGSHGAHGK